MSLNVDASLKQCMSDGVIASLLINGNFVVPKYVGRLNRRGHVQHLSGRILKAIAQNNFRLNAPLGQLLADGVEAAQDKGDFPGSNAMNLPLLGRQQEQCRYVAGLCSRKQSRIVQKTQIRTEPNEVLRHDQVPSRSDKSGSFAEHDSGPDPVERQGVWRRCLARQGGNNVDDQNSNRTHVDFLSTKNFLNPPELGVPTTLPRLCANSNPGPVGFAARARQRGGQ